MRATIHKLFWLWSFDKEEKWLNEMAAKGLVLVSVGLLRYEFENCVPGEYNIRMEMLKNSVNNPESQNYIHFLEDTGIEHVGTLLRWVYFRKKSNTAPFDLFSDIDSRISHINRMLVIPAIFGILNIINAVNMTRQYIRYDMEIALTIAILVWLVSFLMVYGFIRLLIKRNKLVRERMLHE